VDFGDPIEISPDLASLWKTGCKVTSCLYEKTLHVVFSLQLLAFCYVYILISSRLNLVQADQQKAAAAVMELIMSGVNACTLQVETQ
jgi:hypothetical protein